MAPPRLFVGDEELGKKDDDHRPGFRSSMDFMWKPKGVRPHIRRGTVKRIALGLIALVGLYYFFKNMPTDLRNPRPRPSYDHSASGTAASAIMQEGSLSGSPGSPGFVEHNFNGPIQFFQLATSLRSVSGTKGSEPVNRNVLFAASSLKSSAVLLPIACEMAMRERNYVHFAFMGRDEISMEILKAVNGVSMCKILFHDARPDFVLQSSDYRMEVAHSAALNHINNFVHPQAVLIDGTSTEDRFFVKAFRERAGSLGRTLIELPGNAEQTLMWLTQLDSSALSAWSKVSIDILVHAPTDSSGSLLRLLDSLRNADFFACAKPHLTIELPNKVDLPTKKYLENFKWPPAQSQHQGNLLTLHHRISQKGITEEESSIRFLEAFWPRDPISSHVLVLSPQEELSPLFFHYLKYTLLEYKYTNRHDIGLSPQSILGISLDSPSTYLNDTTIFLPPDQKEAAPFLFQAPNSNAMLIFGDKWMELHDLVTRILSVPHAPSKLISKTFPSWLEHILTLARVRGYYTLYPNFVTSDSLATVHNELYQAPPEFSNDDPTELDFTADPENHKSLQHAEKPLLRASLQSLLPNLPLVSEMPLLSWEGNRIDSTDVVEGAAQYKRSFRSEIGGCDVRAREKRRTEFTAADLFCSGDEELDPEVPISEMKTEALVKMLQD